MNYWIDWVNNTMGQLNVFGSRGQRFYPKGGEDDADMQMYFNQLVCALDSSQPDPTIEIYAQVSTGSRREQVSIRYVGDKAKNLIDDCVNAVKNELVEARGWTIHRGTGPERLFSQLYHGQNKQDVSPGKELTRDLDDTSSVAIKTLLTQSQIDHVPWFVASGFDGIAKILPSFQDINGIITISRKQHSPPDFSDLHFTVSSTQRKQFTLHNKTQKKVDEKRQELKREQRKKKMRELESTVAELQDLGVKSSEIKQRLSTSLDNSFPSLGVYTEQEINRIRNQSSSEGRAGQNNKYRSVQSSTLFNNKLIIFFIIVILLSVLAGWIFFGILNNGTGGDIGKEVAIEISNSPSVVPGAGFELSGMINNTMDNQINRSLTLLFDGEEIANQSMSVDSNSQSPFTLTGVAPENKGSHEITVSFGDVETDLILNVSRDSDFEISNVSQQLSAEPSEEIKIYPIVENTGMNSDRQELVFSFEGDEVDNETLDIESGGQEATQFVLPLPEYAEVGEYSFTLTTDDDEFSGVIALNAEEAIFNLLNSKPNLTQIEIESGEEFQINVTVLNNGSVGHSQEITLKVNKQKIDNKSLELEPGENNTATLTAQAPEKAGEYNISVATDDDKISGKLNIIEKEG